MNFPDQITFKSDGNVIVLVPGTEDTAAKDRVATYKFIKSKTNKGKEFPMLLSHIERLSVSGLILIKNKK